MTDPDHLLAMSATARSLGVSIETARAMFDTGQLEGTRTPSGRRLVEPSSIPVAHVSISSAANRLGVSAETVRTWYDHGRLAGYRSPGGQRRISVDSINQALAS